jgi:hypothetical protein
MTTSTQGSLRPLWAIGIVCAGFIGLSYATESGATGVSRLKAPDKTLTPDTAIEAEAPEIQEKVSEAIETITEDPLPTSFPAGVPPGSPRGDQDPPPEF